MINYTCKYCGHECITYILSEKAHVCHKCGTLRAAGIELDTDLFWNQKGDEEYFKHIGYNGETDEKNTNNH